MRAAARVLLLACAVLAAPASETWEMPAAEAAEIRSLADLAAAHGFPDTRGARFFTGELALTWPTAPPGVDPGGNTGGAKLGLLHARLADGTWLACLCLPVRPAPGLVIDASALHEAEPAAIRAAAVREHPVAGWLQREPLAPVLAAQDAATRTWLAACADDAALAYHVRPDWISHLVLPAGATAAACVALVRAGVPGAERTSAALAVQQLYRRGWPDQADTRSPLVLTDGGRQQYDGWWDRHPGPALLAGPLPGPAAGLRRGLRDWFASQLIRRPDPLPVQAPGPAAAAARAFLPPGDIEAAQRLEWDIRRGQLPSTYPDQADLPTRLACWRVEEWLGNGCVVSDADVDLFPAMSREERGRLQPEQLAKLVLLQRTAFGRDDLDALVALADDPRPSRWQETAWRRTVGDQALRAIASVLRVDPRRMWGGDLDASWDDVQRRQVARDLAAWWAENRRLSLDELRGRALLRMTPTEICVLLQGGDAAWRARWLDRLASGWRKWRPAWGYDREVEHLLRLGKDHRDFAATIDALPLAGPSRPVLAAWHLARGRRAPLAELLADGLAAMQPELYGMPWWTQVLPLAARSPRQDELRRLLAALAGPPGQWPCHGLVEACLDNTGSGGEAILDELDRPIHWWDDDHGAHAALPLALFVRLLEDRRPAPADLAARAAVLATDDWDAPAPAGMLLADVAGAVARRRGWFLGVLRPGIDAADREGAVLAFPLTGTRADRDAALQRIHAVYATRLAAAFAAAGLRDEPWLHRPLWPPADIVEPAIGR